MKIFAYTAPSGVPVTSNIAPLEAKWWDDEKRHRYWSWMSWITLVLNARGIRFPRKVFIKHMSR